jgi:hypothetical protein
MPRDARAHLADIIEACDAITVAVHDLDLAGYERNRLVRSSVEREFIIIGEAVAALARIAPKAFDAITRESVDSRVPDRGRCSRVGDRRARYSGASPRVRGTHS